MIIQFYTIENSMCIIYNISLTVLTIDISLPHEAGASVLRRYSKKVTFNIFERMVLKSYILYAVCVAFFKLINTVALENLFYLSILVCHLYITVRITKIL